MELSIIELNSLEYVKLDITSLNVDCLYWNNEEFKDIWIDLIADDLSVEELHDSECEEDDWFKSSNFEYTEVEDKRYWAADDENNNEEGWFDGFCE